MVRKGQSTLEYILLLTAVLVVVIFYVMRFGGSTKPSLAKKLNKMYTVGIDSVQYSSNSFFSSLNNYTSSTFVNSAP